MRNLWNLHNIVFSNLYNCSQLVKDLFFLCRAFSRTRIHCSFMVLQLMLFSEMSIKIGEQKYSYPRHYQIVQFHENWQNKIISINEKKYKNLLMFFIWYFIFLEMDTMHDTKLHKFLKRPTTWRNYLLQSIQFAFVMQHHRTAYTLTVRISNQHYQDSNSKNN